MNIYDLKCGNVLNYCTDLGEIIPCAIDWQDIKWLSEDPKGFNLVHSPIPLTKENLLIFGFEGDGKYLHLKLANNWCFEWFDNNLGFSLCKGKHGLCIGEIKYVHELQNLYYSFTKKMITILTKKNEF